MFQKRNMSAEGLFAGLVSRNGRRRSATNRGTCVPRSPRFDLAKLDLGGGMSTATVETKKGTEEGPGCPKCGNLDSWGTASWCPKCGYYPRLGTCVDEKATPVEEPAPEPAKSWTERVRRIPRWGVALALGVIAVFIFSLVGRIATPPKSVPRSLWGTLQLIIGFLLFAVMHGWAFFGSLMKEGGGMLDFVLHPLDIWRPVFQNLPRSAKRIWLGSWGLAAAIFAVTIIGGIRYSVLYEDWGFKKRAKSNLVQSIKDAVVAAAEEEQKAVEKAIDEMAGEGEEETKEGEDAKKNEDGHEVDRLQSDCVIVGFNLDKEEGRVKEVLLATLMDGQLKYVGIVSKDIPPEIEKQLRKQLPGLTREKAVVKCNHTATWVSPKLICKVSFKTWSDSKQMQEPAMKELMAEVGK